MTGAAAGWCWCWPGAPSPGRRPSWCSPPPGDDHHDDSDDDHDDSDDDHHDYVLAASPWPGYRTFISPPPSPLTQASGEYLQGHPLSLGLVIKLTRMN